MNEADQHLLQLIRAGDHDGWNQFVARFQKRLMAFASRQVDQQATAEDLVQETFVAFLGAMAGYREECELESYLFQILRRRIMDHYRRQGRNREVPACAFGSANEEPGNPLQQATADNMHASWYMQREEARGRDFDTLATAVRQFAVSLQQTEKFRDLKIAEGLFYAGIRNLELAAILKLSEHEISNVKHRLVKRLAAIVREIDPNHAENKSDEIVDRQLLTSVWESQRPSCPKRTTLGKLTLGILPPEWDDFARFHVATLGCTFCNANLAELQAPCEQDEQTAIRERLFLSTIGFLGPTEAKS